MANLRIITDSQSEPGLRLSVVLILQRVKHYIIKISVA